ncbi:hypothetical protein EYR38_006218 [Pleurotus pulmonarius]|nr:hypothetical protein EYR38_006218 [Pleurotus pulmonarius]
MAYHYGSNVFGLSVTDYDPEFKAKVTPIFNRFLQTCYSPEQSPIAVEEVAEQAPPPSLSLSTPQEMLPTPNPPSLASPSLPSQAPVLPPTAIPASPLSLPKVPPGLLPCADTPTSVNVSPGLPSSPDAPSYPALLEIPPEFEFDWGSFAPYAGMQCTIPPTSGHMSLLDEMVAPLPIDCYSQGIAMPVPSFLHSSSVAPSISQPVVHQPASVVHQPASVVHQPVPPISQPVVHQPASVVHQPASVVHQPVPPILQPVVHQPALPAPSAQPVDHQPAPPTPSGAALPMLQPVVHQPAPVILQAPPILQPAVHQSAPPAPSVMLPGADTPALAPIIPATGVHAPDDINGSGNSALSVDAISTDIASKPTKPPRRKRPRDDGTDPSFIVTTKRARKPQERTEIDTITKPLVKDKENRYGIST